MTSRLKKQIFIIFIFLSILFLIGFLFYFILRPAPSCYDGVKNQQEEEIDCGGPCISCEIKTLKDIEVLMVKAIPSLEQEGVYDLAAQINNLNQNHGAAQIVYQFRFYDLANNLISTKEGRGFILPNEKKYIIEPRVEIGQRVGRIGLNIARPEWRKLKDFERPQIFIQNKQYSRPEKKELGLSRVSGTVRNASPFDFDKVEVKTILLNRTQEIIAVNKTELRTLLSGEERYFVTTWFSEIADDVFFVEALAETNIFLDENFMKRFGAPEKFQEFIPQD